MITSCIAVGMTKLKKKMQRENRNEAKPRGHPTLGKQDNRNPWRKQKNINQGNQRTMSKVQQTNQQGKDKTRGQLTFSNMTDWESKKYEGN